MQEKKEDEGINIEEIRSKAVGRFDREQNAAEERTRRKLQVMAEEKALEEEIKKEILADPRWIEIYKIAHSPELRRLLELENSRLEMTFRECPYRELSTEKNTDEIWGYSGPCIFVNGIKVYYDNEICFECLKEDIADSEDDPRKSFFVVVFKGMKQFAEAFAENVFSGKELYDNEKGKKITRTGFTR